MRRRKVLALVGSTGIATIAGCSGGNSGSGQASCSAPSTDDLQSLFPSNSDKFNGQYGTSEGLSGIGTDNYFVGRYNGPNGGTHDLLVAKYPSQTKAQNNRKAVLSKTEFPATGYLITGQYLVVVDAQTREMGRQLLRASKLDDGCVSQLTFTSGSSGMSNTTTTDSSTPTEEPTETQTETETPTPEPVVASLTDDFEDGDYQSNPTWFTSGGNVSVVDVSAPDGGTKALQFKTNSKLGASGYSEVESATKLRFDAPWQIRGMMRMTSPLRASAYKVAFGSTKFRMKLRVKEGNKSQRRLQAGVEGDLINNANQLSTTIVADQWYNYRVRHDGNGGYTLDLWQADKQASSGNQATARGNAPSDKKRPLRVRTDTVTGFQDTIIHQTSYINYRTEAAMDN